jgi:hypothetical protein
MAGQHWVRTDRTEQFRESPYPERLTHTLRTCWDRKNSHAPGHEHDWRSTQKKAQEGLRGGLEMMRGGMDTKRLSIRCEQKTSFFLFAAACESSARFVLLIWAHSHLFVRQDLGRVPAIGHRGK